MCLPMFNVRQTALLQTWVLSYNLAIFSTLMLCATELIAIQSVRSQSTQPSEERDSDEPVASESECDRDSSEETSAASPPGSSVGYSVGERYGASPPKTCPPRSKTPQPSPILPQSPAFSPTLAPRSSPPTSRTPTPTLAPAAIPTPAREPVRQEPNPPVPQAQPQPPSPEAGNDRQPVPAPPPVPNRTEVIPPPPPVASQEAGIEASTLPTLPARTPTASSNGRIAAAASGNPRPQFPTPIPNQSPVSNQPLNQSPVSRQPVTSGREAASTAAPSITTLVASAQPLYEDPAAGVEPATLTPQPRSQSDRSIRPHFPVPQFIGAAATPTPTATQTAATHPPVGAPQHHAAVTPPKYEFQGVYLHQGDSTSARMRIGGVYPIAPNAIIGGSVQVTTGDAFADSQTEGFDVNELYLAASLPDLPNLRFLVGQLDLTSYFDRNSFAKDGATHFFNGVFQTNPALSRTGIGSRPALLVNWSVNDNIEAKVSGFSSARELQEFSIDGFAAEIALRTGNFIVRGTYATDRDGGRNDSFRESFDIRRSGNDIGVREDDREQAYGINAEVFIPEAKLGLFARYGHYDNLEIDLGGDTFSLGFNLLDIFLNADRLGIAYGRDLSNDSIRRKRDEDVPDVFEAFYDIRLLSNVRVGFSLQSLDNFSETILGIRVKTEFNMTPLERE